MSRGDGPVPWFTQEEQAPDVQKESRLQDSSNVLAVSDSIRPMTAVGEPTSLAPQASQPVTWTPPHTSTNATDATQPQPQTDFWGASLGSTFDLPPMVSTGLSKKGALAAYGQQQKSEREAAAVEEQKKREMYQSVHEEDLARKESVSGWVEDVHAPPAVPDRPAMYMQQQEDTQATLRDRYMPELNISARDSHKIRKKKRYAVELDGVEELERLAQEGREERQKQEQLYGEQDFTTPSRIQERVTEGLSPVLLGPRSEASPTPAPEPHPAPQVLPGNQTRAKVRTETGLRDVVVEDKVTSRAMRFASGKKEKPARALDQRKAGRIRLELGDSKQVGSETGASTKE